MTIRIPLLATALAIAIPFAATVAAQDITFEEVWRVETAQSHFTRPVIDGEVLYIGGEDGVLRALDKQTGEATWVYEAGAGIGSGAGFDDMRVYVTSRDGLVHGVDKATGEGLWTFETGGEKQWDYWDFYLSTPVPDDQHWLYFGSGDHHVYSINKRSGAFRWKFETGAIVHGDPVLSGEKVIIGGFDGRMYALDRADGRQLWAFKTVGNAYFRAGEIPGSAAVADGIVYFGSRDYNLYALLEDTGTGAWNIRTPSWVVARPLVVDGRVYVGISDGPRVYSIDARSSREYWETPVGLNVFGGAEALGTRLIAVAGLDGRINLMDRESGEIVAHHDTREATENRSKMFDAEGKPIAGTIETFEDVFALYDRFFRDLGGIAGGLAVEGDMLYYATGGGSVTAIRANGVALAEDAD